jgi:hypothetical protein
MQINVNSWYKFRTLGEGKLTRIEKIDGEMVFTVCTPMNESGHKLTLAEIRAEKPREVFYHNLV